jgi:hypothetical protein
MKTYQVTYKDSNVVINTTDKVEITMLKVNSSQKQYDIYCNAKNKNIIDIPSVLLGILAGVFISMIIDFILNR